MYCKLLLFSLLALNLNAKLIIPDILQPNKEQKSTKIISTFQRTGPTVQIGVLLDTSGSMNGLLNQAREQIWKIVNEVANANKNDKDVAIQVGLFEYGKDSIAKYEGYLQMLSPLSSDLDNVSKELFALRTNGGSEYSGKVILEAVNRFAWSADKEDLKILIIAGNESFSQGDVPYSEAIKKAKANNIIVNTIFCGDYNSGINLKWQDGANLGNGKYLNINQDKKVIHIHTPYDDEIIVLGRQINETYIYFGSSHKERKRNMMIQDGNAQGLSKSSYIQRSIVKSKKQYVQKKYDAVESMDSVSFESIPKEEKPSILQNKTDKEVKKILQEAKEKREKIQKQISKLEVKRKEFLKNNKPKESKDLGSVIVQSIKEQAIQNGFKFKK